jgi:hypothetical protein
VAAKARQVVASGDPVRGMRLADAALAHDPASCEALEAKLLALKTLQAKARNSLEHGWLGYGIRTTQERLDGLEEKAEGRRQKAEG